MCFNLNKRGEEGANCGRDKSSYIPCAAPYVHSTCILNVALKAQRGLLSDLISKCPWRKPSTQNWKVLKTSVCCNLSTSSWPFCSFVLNRNLKCGSMFCEGGGESISGKRADFRLLGLECKLAVDDDKSRNIDMVPKGTKCGPNKVTPPVETHHVECWDLWWMLCSDQTCVCRSASTTDVWISQCMGKRRTVQRNATTMG